MKPPAESGSETARRGDSRRAILDAVSNRLRGVRGDSADGARGTQLSLDSGAHGEAASGPALVEPFRRAVETVAGRCTVVRDLSSAAEVVRAVLDACHAHRLASSDAPLVREVLTLAGFPGEVLVAASPHEIFSCDAGITTAQWGVAETGTLVLDGDAERHRLASLVPPVHIALLTAERLRPTIGSVLHELARRPPQTLSRCVTFVTGPSRTSDIELTLAIGVHGPGELHVIVLD